MCDIAGHQSQNLYFQHRLLNELLVAQAIFDGAGDVQDTNWETKYVRLTSHHNLLIVPLLSLCELKFDWQTQNNVSDEVNAKAYIDAVSCLQAELRSLMPLAHGATTLA